MLVDQEKSVRLCLLNFGPGESLAHARAHRAIIRRFGRFPFRNAALGRTSTQEEKAFLARAATGRRWPRSPPEAALARGRRLR